MKLKVERKNIISIIEITIGLIAFSIEFNLFISPLNIVVGGSGGLALIFRKLFDFDTSTFITIFYVLMVIVNLLVYGFKNTEKLILGSILYPIAINLFKNITDVIVLDYSNTLLLCIFTGLVSGIGCGLTYKNNFLTGGTDIPKKIMSDKLKMSMGTAIRIFDGTLIILGGFIFGLKSVLYAIIIMYISSTVTDRMILGISNKKVFYIVTDKTDEIVKYIRNKLKYGVTKIEVTGGYKKESQDMIMCVISTRDYVKLKDVVNRIDKNAFFIITDSYYTNKQEVKYGIN